MDVCICGDSAVELWRVWRLAGSRGFLEMGVCPSRKFMRDWRSCTWVSSELPVFQAPSESWLSQLTDTSELGLSAPVDIYVTQGERRARAARKTAHLLPKSLPPRSIVQISTHVFAISPEAALSHVCAGLSRAEAVRLLGEFCGRYATDPGQEGGFLGCDPLVDTEGLAAFCACASGFRGAARMANHLPFVCNGCASPMETAMIASLCLPPHDGGYGLPLPQANLPMLPTDTVLPLMDRSHYVGDAVWPEHRVVAEFDSKAVHANQTAVAHDNVRRTAIEAMGYHVVNVTLPTLATPKLLGKVATDLFKRLGRRLRPERFDAAWRKRQADTLHELIEVPLRWWRLAVSGNGTAPTR